MTGRANERKENRKKAEENEEITEKKDSKEVGYRQRFKKKYQSDWSNTKDADTGKRCNQ